MWMQVGSGLLLAMISLPLIFRKIRPNGLYGFRVRRTLEDPRLWVEVNAYAGVRLLIAGLVTALAAVLLYFIPGLSLDAYSLLCLGVSFTALVLSIWQSVRYLNRLDGPG